MTNASEYYIHTKPNYERNTHKIISKRRYMLFQLIVVIKIRRAPTTTKHDTKDFQPLIIKSSDILPPISITVTDKGYDSEKIIMSL
jgi:hypothetical protein